MLVCNLTGIGHGVAVQRGKSLVNMKPPKYLTAKVEGDACGRDHLTSSSSSSIQATSKLGF